MNFIQLTACGHGTLPHMYNECVHLSSSGGFLTEWVRSIISGSIEGRDKLTDVGRVEINMKVFRDFDTFVGIIEGESYKERLNLQESKQLHYTCTLLGSTCRSVAFK